MGSQVENRIAIEQNRLERIVLLRAQRRLYSRAKVLQTVFAVLALLLPALSVIVGPSLPAIRPYVALGSVALLLFEVVYLLPKLRELTRNGAKLQEQFDTEVLELGWNRLASGAKVDIEDIRDIGDKPFDREGESKLPDWYEPSVASLPISTARIICQRTNVTYDARTRKKYADCMFFVLLGLGLLLFVSGLAQDRTLESLLLSVFVPFMPLATFIAREYRKQKDTIESLTTLKSEADKLWDKVLKHAPPAELAADSRGLQDAIYRHRSSSPLIYDWVYSWLRRKNEDVASATAKQLVKDALRGREEHKTA